MLTFMLLVGKELRISAYSAIRLMCAIFYAPNREPEGLLFDGCVSYRFHMRAFEVGYLSKT